MEVHTTHYHSSWYRRRTRKTEVLGWKLLLVLNCGGHFHLPTQFHVKPVLINSIKLVSTGFKVLENGKLTTIMLLRDTIQLV